MSKPESAPEERGRELEIAEAWKYHIIRNTRADKLPDLGLGGLYELLRFGRFELSETAKNLQLIPSLTGVEYRVTLDHNLPKGKTPVTSYEIYLENGMTDEFCFNYGIYGILPTNFHSSPEDIYTGEYLEFYQLLLERLHFLHEQGHLILEQVEAEEE